MLPRTRVVLLSCFEFEHMFQRSKIFNFDWCSGSGSNQEGDATAHSTSEVWKPYFKSSANYFQIGNTHSFFHKPLKCSPICKTAEKN